MKIESRPLIAHEGFIFSCGEDEICVPFGDAVIKMPKTVFWQMMAIAFRNAFIDALQKLNPRINAKPAVESLDYPTGTTSITTTIVDEATGERATGTSELLDPRKAENLAMLRWSQLPNPMPLPSFAVN